MITKEKETETPLFLSSNRTQVKVVFPLIWQNYRFKPDFPKCVLPQTKECGDRDWVEAWLAPSDLLDLMIQNNNKEKKYERQLQ